MPSVLHGGDELTDLPEAPSATENGGTQAHYGISQHRIIAEKEGERDGGSGSLPPEKFLQSSRTLEHALLEHGMNAVITINICSLIKS